MVVESGSHFTIAVRSDRVTVIAGGDTPVEVRGGRLIAEPDGRFRVDAAKGPIELHCAERTSVTIGTTSGQVECRGRLGAVHITTSSGRVSVEDATSIDVRTKSGHVEVGSCEGPCTVRTKSSTVEIGQAAELDVSTTSGHVTATAVSDATVQTVSGAVELSIRGKPNVLVRGQSASIDVTLPTGATPATNLVSNSGHVTQQCLAGTDGRVEIATSSGAINLSCR